MTEALKQIWDKVDRMMGPQRMETEAEHIARDMREGRFPERSDPIQVPVNPKPEAKTDLITAEDARKLLDEGAKGYIAAYPPSLVVDLARTVIALHAQLADAKAAQALVVERAEEAVDAEWRRKVGLNCTEVCAIIRALAHPSGLAMLAELRAERDAAIGDRTMARAGREIAIADRDELRAAIFGSPDYAADLRNGNFREMAETLHSAQKGGIARAEKAEAERDRLAAANAVLEAKVAGLRSAFRVNMLRFGPPGTSHEEIDAAIDAALATQEAGT